MNTPRKYELTDGTKQVNGVILHRIKALIDLDEVKAGDLGGWIESEYNLCQAGECWVYDNAVVYGGASVSDDAQIRDDARIIDNARISCSAIVRGNAVIGGFSVVGGTSCIDRSYAPDKDSRLVRDTTIK